MRAYDKFRVRLTDHVLVRCVYFVDAPHRVSTHYPENRVRITLYYRPDGYDKSMRFMIDMSRAEALAVARDLIGVANSTKEFSLQRSEFYGS